MRLTNRERGIPRQAAWPRIPNRFGP